MWTPLHILILCHLVLPSYFLLSEQIMGLVGILTWQLEKLLPNDVEL